MTVRNEGDQFEVRDSIMTLVSKIGKDKWIVSCSKCSLDTELFPLGSITSHAHSLSKGSCSCLCARTPYLTEEQNKILVIRECIKRDYKFIGWDGEYNGKINTKIKAVDLRTNDVVTLPRINSFLGGSDDNKRCVGLDGLISKNKVKPIEHYIDLFLSTGSFVSGTTFERDPVPGSTGRYERWFVSCPICKEDEYTKAGLCNGVFNASYASLKAGNLPCRCKDNPPLTSAQYELKMNNLVTAQGFTFIGFNTDDIRQTSKFDWLCAEGHENSTSINNFLRGRGCGGSCRYKSSAVNNGYGEYEGRADEDDNLYLINLYNKEESFIKIGRSFNMRERMWSIGRYYDVEILSTVQDKHLSVLEMEAELHKEFREFHYNPLVPFKGGMFECMSLEVLEKPKIKEIFNLA